MLHVNLWPKLAQSIHIFTHYPREPVIVPYLCQYRSTLSFLNNPYTDSYQYNLSHSPQNDSESLYEPFNTTTSVKTKQNNCTTPTKPN